MKLDPLSTRKQLEQGLETQAGEADSAQHLQGKWRGRGLGREEKNRDWFSAYQSREGPNLHPPLIQHLSFSLLKYCFSLYCGSSWSPFKLVLPHILPV